MRSRPFCRAASLISRTTVGRPLAAQTWAMPEPMRPQPMTPTFWMAIGVPILPLLRSGVQGLAPRLDDPERLGVPLGRMTDTPDRRPQIAEAVAASALLLWRVFAHAPQPLYRDWLAT